MAIPEHGSTSSFTNNRRAPFDSDVYVESQKFLILDIFIRLLNQKMKIAKIVLGFVLVGSIVCLILPRQYTSTVKIMPPQKSQSGAAIMASQLLSSAGGSVAALAGGGGLGLKNPNDIYIGILESRVIADDLIAKYNLQNLYHAKDMTAARKKLKAYTDIVSEKSGLVSVAVTDRDKQRAAGIANSYIDELRALTNTLEETEADQRVEFYSKRLNEKKIALDEAERQLRNIQQSKNLLQPDAQGRITVTQISTLENQISAKEVELKGLENYSTADNPQVRIVMSELASLRQHLAQLRQQTFQNGSPNAAAGNLPDASLAYFNAEHEVRYRQTMFDLLARQYDAALLDSGRDANVLQVLEPAIVSDRKSFPLIGILLALFTLAGLLCGCSWVLIMWKTEEIRTSAAFQEKLGILRSQLGRSGPSR